MPRLGQIKPFCKRGHDLSQTRIFKNGRSTDCRECSRERGREIYANGDTPERRARRIKWNTTHPEDYRRSRFKSFLKKKYKLDINEYHRMLAAQQNHCAVCGDEPNTKHGRLCIDHDHATGKVRALLCNHCNVAIAHVREDPMRAYRVATYLQKHI